MGKCSFAGAAVLQAPWTDKGFREQSPHPQTAPGRTPRGSTLLPSRPAHLAPAPGAGAWTAMTRDQTKAANWLPPGRLGAEYEERVTGRRGAGPRRPQTRADREERAEERGRSRKRPISRKEPKSAEHNDLSTRRLERPLLDQGGSLLTRGVGQMRLEYFMTSILNSEYSRHFTHSPR